MTPETRALVRRGARKERRVATFAARAATVAGLASFPRRKTAKRYMVLHPTSWNRDFQPRRADDMIGGAVVRDRLQLAA
jgi:hypothetical protein